MNVVWAEEDGTTMDDKDMDMNMDHEDHEDHESHDESDDDMDREDVGEAIQMAWDLMELFCEMDGDLHGDDHHEEHDHEHDHEHDDADLMDGGEWNEDAMSPEVMSAEGEGRRLQGGEGEFVGEDEATWSPTSDGIGMPGEDESSWAPEWTDEEGRVDGMREDRLEEGSMMDGEDLCRQAQDLLREARKYNNAD